MRTTIAAAIAARLLTACSDGEYATRTGPERRAQSTTEATPPATRRPRDVVAPKTVLRRVRAIEDRFSRVDERLAIGVGAVSGLESHVRSWDPAGWRRIERFVGFPVLGLADLYAFEIHLHPGVCETLAELLAGARPESGQDALMAAEALVALTHERLT
jgi:hypothetical protein